MLPGYAILQLGLRIPGNLEHHRVFPLQLGLKLRLGLGLGCCLIQLHSLLETHGALRVRMVAKVWHWQLCNYLLWLLILNSSFMTTCHLLLIDFLIFWIQRAFRGMMGGRRSNRVTKGTSQLPSTPLNPWSETLDGPDVGSESIIFSFTTKRECSNYFYF